MKRIVLASMLPLLVALGGCMGPPVMLAADVVQAAVKASIEYADRHRPTPRQAWIQENVDRLREAAVAGDPRAQFRLGLYYEGVRQPEAERWVCRAANQGFARAQAEMGHWYNEDRRREDLWPFIGLSPDDRLAYMWYSLAVANGDRNADHFRERLRDGRMSPSQLAAARALVVAWQPGGCGWTSTAASTPSSR